MAVTVTDSLPTQPTAGSSVYRPLGGDGWTAPHAQYSVLQQLAGDASGTTNSIALNLDLRFMNIVSLMEILYTGATAAIEGEMHVLSDRPTGARHRVRMFGTTLFLATLNDQGLLSWNPPLLLDADSVTSVIENVDSTVHNLLTTVYCFQKRALHQVPLNVLLASLPSVQFTNVNA